MKAVLKFSESAPSIDELYRSTGKAVLVTVASAAEFTGGMDEVRGESDQRAMDLGQEYTDEDGDGMGQDDAVIDVEARALPAPGNPEKKAA